MSTFVQFFVILRQMSTFVQFFLILRQMSTFVQFFIILRQMSAFVQFSLFYAKCLLSFSFSLFYVKCLPSFNFSLFYVKCLTKIKIHCQDVRQGRLHCHISLSKKHSLQCHVPNQRSPHLNKTETSTTLIQVTCRSNCWDETLYILLTRVFSFQSTSLITKSINEALFL
jgi:hypothetical protein